MDNPTYVSGKHVCKTLGVHVRTLYQWDKQGKIDTIRTPGNFRLYNLEKYMRNLDPAFEQTEESIEENIEERLRIIYTRVSSQSQSNDLERQKLYMAKRYPNHLLIEDIGSGMNFNRIGLRKIIKWAIAGRVEEVVVANKDRLARFGFELFEDIIKEYSKGKIIVMRGSKTEEPEEELVKDMLQIMNIFTAKMNGLIKYKDTD